MPSKKKENEKFEHRTDTKIDRSIEWFSENYSICFFWFHWFGLQSYFWAK